MNSSVKARSVEEDGHTASPNLEAAAGERFSTSADAAHDFFAANVDRLVMACFEMARRFEDGGRLLVFGAGASATDAQHLAVEFVHPIIAGNKALSVVALAGNEFMHQIRVMGGPKDMAMGIAAGPDRATVAAALGCAAASGLMTLSLSGGASRQPLPADFAFVAPCDDPMIAQEVHEMAYHVLWESVHMFMGRGGTSRTDAVGAHPDECEHLLYPFLNDRPLQVATGPLFAEVRQSMLLKCEQMVDLRRSLGRSCGRELAAAARAIASAFAAGGRLWTLGNGGSATDAADLAHDFLWPPGGHRPLPAMALTDDVATVTGVANDIGFENVFVRQLIALARTGDIVVGITTSGNSANIINAFKTARRLGLVTIALTGEGGGDCARLAESGIIDHLFVIPCEHTPRTQEVHAKLYHALWELTHRVLDGGDP